MHAEKRARRVTKSAVIPVLGDGEYLAENVFNLLEDGYEVILAVDEPSDRVLEFIRECSGCNVKVTMSEKRRGKWRALNDALKLASGDYILFLDSDTKLVDTGKLDELMEEYDAVEIRKDVNASSMLEKLASIDYLLMYLIARLTFRLGSCLTVNGSAFCVKRDVILSLGGFRPKITEDADLGIRIGLSGYRTAVSGKALTKAPSTLKEWFVQKERWCLGGSQLLVENFHRVLLKPKMWLPITVLFYPAIIGLLVAIAMPDSFLLKLLSFLIPLLFLLPSNVLSIALLAVFELHTVKNIFAILISFTIWLFVMIIASRKLDYRIEYRLLPVYYFVYSPMWGMVGLVSLMRVLIFLPVNWAIKRLRKDEKNVYVGMKPRNWII